MSRIAKRNLQSANRKLRSPRLGFLVLIVMFAGCGKSGPELAPVRGRVTLDARPLETADVVFQPDDSKSPSYGRTDADGHYELLYKRGVKGALVGWHTVQIEDVTEITRKPQRVSPRYNTQSTLHVEVKPGEDNVFDFALTSDKT